MNHNQIKDLKTAIRDAMLSHWCRSFWVVFLGARCREWVLTVCWVCLGKEKINVTVWGKFCGEKRGKSRKITWELGKKREMWGVKDEDFRGFYQRVHFMFLGKYGKKSGNEEDFGEIQRKRRLQLSVIS